MWRFPLISLCYGCGESLTLDEEGGEQRDYCAPKFVMNHVHEKGFNMKWDVRLSVSVTACGNAGIKVLNRSWGDQHLLVFGLIPPGLS